ncbi:hypothetical protein UlMin_033759 [Ulmus minor]
MEHYNITSNLSSLHYYLAYHPTILNFSWTPGQTLGASPLFVAVAVLSYLSLTLLLPRLALPAISPQILRPVTFLHSVSLFLLSAAMAGGCFLNILTHTPRHHPHWIFCYPLKIHRSGPFFFWAYVFYLSKYLEFVDTLLIILSRSIRRLTFLHVFHHCMVVVMCYLSLEMAQSMFLTVVISNSAVHVVMYCYYALCAIGIRPKWKKVVTECQILQFKLSFVATALVLYLHYVGVGCSGVRSWCFNVVLTASLLALFINFHNKNYSKGSSTNKGFGDNRVHHSKDV